MVLSSLFLLNTLRGISKVKPEAWKSRTNCEVQIELATGIENPPTWQTTPYVTQQFEQQP